MTTLPHPERIAYLEARVDACTSKGNENAMTLAVHTEQISEGREAQKETRQELSALRKVIIMAAVSFAGSSILFAFTVQLLVGR